MNTEVGGRGLRQNSSVDLDLRRTRDRRLGEFSRRPARTRVEQRHLATVLSLGSELGGLVVYDCRPAAAAGDAGSRSSRRPE
jgi:hypothetical protein